MPAYLPFTGIRQLRCKNCKKFTFWKVGLSVRDVILMEEEMKRLSVPLTGLRI
jgi:hypothetical protein